MNRVRSLLIPAALLLAVGLAAATVAAAKWALPAAAFSPAAAENAAVALAPAARANAAGGVPDYVAPPAAQQDAARRSTSFTPQSPRAAALPPGQEPAPIWAAPRQPTPDFIESGGDWDGLEARYPFVLEDGGEYQMWYNGFNIGGKAYIGYATSPDGVNWTKHPGNPVLSPGAAGEWDADGVQSPFVIRESSSSYKMWFSGYGAGGGSIGYATSTDGVVWTKYAGNPVLTPGGDPWNNVEVMQPSLLFEDGMYKMWLMTHGDDGSGNTPYFAYATSPDGMTWTWDAANPLFGVTWEGWIWRPMVQPESGGYRMWYSVWAGSGQISFADAPDETTWTKHGSPILTGDPGWWDEPGASDPTIIESSGAYTMYYDNFTDIGLATSADGVNWSKPLNAPVLTRGAAGVAAQLNYAHDWVIARSAPGEAITITVATTQGVKATLAGQTGSDGELRSWEWPWQPWQPDIAAGDIVTVATSAAQTEINPIGEIEAQVDASSDTISGFIHAPWFAPLTLTVRCEIWVEAGPPPIVVEGIPADGGSFSCDYGALGFDVLPDHDAAVFYYEPDGDSVVNVLRAPWMRVNLADNRVGGDYPENHTVWITVTDNGGGFKASAELQTTSWGGWGAPGFETQPQMWTPENPDIQPGDWTHIRIDDGYTNTILAGEISGELDLDENTLTGEIHASWLDTPTVTVFCGIWYVPAGVPDIRTSADPDGGGFTCDYDDVGWDLGYGHGAMARYREPDGDSVINIFVEPDPNLFLRVNYGHDWAESFYEGGHSVWITVTDSTGAVKATASGETGGIPWWGSQTGFVTDYNVFWNGPRPDLQAGDWVYGAVDSGYSAAVELGEISGTIDLDADSIGGPIFAPWYSETLPVECHAWGSPGGAPMKYSDAAPDGSAPYFCQWDPNSEWDILAGEDVGVAYSGADGHWVANAFHVPAPHLAIQTWMQSAPGAGGNAEFYVQFRNDGDGVSADTLITATLEGFDYIGDTSGYPAATGVTPGGDPFVVWDVGSLPPSQLAQQFSLFVEVLAPADSPVTTTVEIETSVLYRQGDPWNKISWWSGYVIDNETQLNIGKNAWTGDPAPGYDFIWAVNACNNGGTGSSPVIVTDTLPASTTLVDWWGQHPGWVELSSTPDALVVGRDSLGGYRCSEVYLRLHVDEAVQAGGWPLTNTAVLTASNDLFGGDNTTTNIVWTGAPRANLWLVKDWFAGGLYPGGQLHTEISYGNNGNIPVENAVLVSEFPVSATFVGAWYYDELGPHLVTPTLVDDKAAWWELGTLDNGFGGRLDIVLGLDPLAQPGIALDHSVWISSSTEEEFLADNGFTLHETLNDFGPNLRVEKISHWDWEGALGYEVRVINLGNERLAPVWISDTYPLDVAYTEEWWVNHGAWVTQTHHAADGEIAFWVEGLDAGGTASIGLRVYPLSNTVQLYTNTLDAPYPGDIWPADNFVEQTAFSGPDIWVTKGNLLGELLPGGVITFDLGFGNQQSGEAWWWMMQSNAILTDVWPAGLEFLHAEQYNCGWTLNCDHSPAQVDGNLVWTLWTLHPGEWNRIRVTARITDTANGLDVYWNEAALGAEQPFDEVNRDNNASILEIPVKLPYLEIGKVVAGGPVAGMPVTYTLTAANPGNAPATGAQVEDWLPDWLTYGGGGSFNAGQITWTVSEIAAGGSADVSFWGALQCEAGAVVNNEFYRVYASDQGVLSEYGQPVSFTIAAPSILAGLETSALAILPGETVFFTSTSATNGLALTPVWDFGDGITTTGVTASHTFATPGSHAVTLTVSDGCGFSDEASVTIQVGWLKIFLPLILRALP